MIYKWYIDCPSFFGLPNWWNVARGMHQERLPGGLYLGRLVEAWENWIPSIGFTKKNRRKPYKKPVGGPCFPVDSVNPLIMIPVAPRKYSTCSVTCGPGTKSRNRGFQQVRVTRTRIVGWYSDRYTCFFEWQWLDGFRRYEYGMNRIEKILRWKIFTEIYKISI